MKYVYESERIGFIKLEEKYKLDYIRMYLDKRIQEKIFKKFYNEEQISKWVEKLINENNNLHREINRRIKLKIENEKIVDNEFISKNKIRKKIKRLDYNSDNTEQRYFKKEVLQELLNENHIPHID